MKDAEQYYCVSYKLLYIFKLAHGFNDNLYWVLHCLIRNQLNVSLSELRLP